MPTPKPTFNARLYTAGELLNMDPDVFQKLNRSELAGVVRTLADVGNKRRQRLEKRGILSPANFNRETGEVIQRFSTKGKSLNALRAELTRVRNFLTAKTSTVKGVEEWKKKSMTMLEGYGVQLDEETFDTVWKTYERLKEVDKSVAEKGLKYRIVDEIRMEIKKRGLTDDTATRDDYRDIALKMQQRVRSIYEEWQRGENELQGPEQLLTRRSGGEGFGPNY